MLAEQDPLIDLWLDGDEIAVSLYGEVQKEVIETTLAHEYGLTVTFRATTTIHVERPVGTGAAVGFIDVDPNPFLATVGLRVTPAAPGRGVVYGIGVEQSHMHQKFDKSMSSTAGDFRLLVPLVLATPCGRPAPGSTNRCTPFTWRSRPTRSGRCCPRSPGTARSPARRRCAGRSPCSPATSRPRGSTRCSSSSRP